MRANLANGFRQLEVYELAMTAAMLIFEASAAFPPVERFSMTDQMRRSSRSVCANLAEAWRKRRYRAAFIAELNDAEGEAAETLVWIDFARRCGYLPTATAEHLFDRYDHILAGLVVMIDNADRWLIRPKSPGTAAGG